MSTWVLRIPQEHLRPIVCINISKNAETIAGFGPKGPTNILEAYSYLFTKPKCLLLGSVLLMCVCWVRGDLLSGDTNASTPANIKILPND